MVTLVKSLIAVPDLHYPHADDELVEKVLSLIQMEKFDIIVQLGDVLDFEKLSRFKYDPSKAKSIMVEIAKGRNFFVQARHMAPNSRIIMKCGNHDERLVNFLMDKAPVLLELEDLNVPTLLQLDKSRVEFYDTDEELIIDGLCITHGWHVRAKAGYSAHGALDNCDYRWGISGHTHRAAQVTRFGRTWIESGHLGSKNPKDFKYNKDKRPDWQQAFTVGYLFENSETGERWWDLKLINVYNGTIHFNGRVF